MQIRSLFPPYKNEMINEIRTIFHYKVSHREEIKPWLTTYIKVSVAAACRDKNSKLVGTLLGRTLPGIKILLERKKREITYDQKKKKQRKENRTDLSTVPSVW